jgi:lipoprotein-releasing system permease protein
MALDDPGNIIIGTELASILGAAPGDELELFSLGGENFSLLAPVKKQLKLVSLFQSSFYEYDTGLVFVSPDAGSGIFSAASDLYYGIKLHRRFNDRQAAALIAGLGVNADSVISWREFNRSFFSALKMEKLVMMLLLCLIFIVVGVNIKNSLERNVVERYEEIAVLKALGAKPEDIKTVFISEGLMIGSAGCLSGYLAGLFITSNINNIFSAAEGLVNFILGLFMKLASSGGEVFYEQFSIFSSNYFYIQEIDAFVTYGESLFIVMFAFLSAIGAASAASGKVSEIIPAEILRNE